MVVGTVNKLERASLFQNNYQVLLCDSCIMLSQLVFFILKMSKVSWYVGVSKVKKDFFCLKADAMSDCLPITTATV